MNMVCTCAKTASEAINSWMYARESTGCEPMSEKVCVTIEEVMRGPCGDLRQSKVQSGANMLEVRILKAWMDGAP
jgi:hypothetical protein